MTFSAYDVIYTANQLANTKFTMYSLQSNSDLRHYLVKFLIDNDLIIFLFLFSLLMLPVGKIKMHIINILHR